MTAPAPPILPPCPSHARPPWRQSSLVLSAAGVPLQAIELGESVSKFVLWELMAIYGCREYDPESFSPYELRNGVNEERDEELSLLVFAHWQEDANDKGLSAVRWVKLEDIMRQLRDCELAVLDH